MKIERTKNASRNIIFGSILKIYQIVIPFLMRTIMFYLMGVQYLGLNSLFASILQVLNLAELGVGSAMVFSMYKPIAEDDEVTICALMKLYKKYYNIIGLVIALVGIILTPFIPKLIKGDVPSNINIYILYLLNLGATALSYWLLAYKNSILQAHQRMDVISKINIITNTVQYILQIVILIVFRNYYIYVIVMLVTQVLTNIITATVATKMYPMYNPIGDLSEDVIKSINQRIRDLFASKIGTIIVNSADTIVISAFLGLTVLAIYQNYYFILTAVIGIVEVAFTACTAGIGNSLIVESKEKNFEDLKKFTFIISWIAGFCTCCFLNMYQPFMKIWVGDKLMLQYPAVICLCIYFYIYEINRIFNTYKDAGGIWHQDRFRPLVTAIANLGMNLIMVQFWGIYGVILSTVLSMMIVGIPWLFHNLFTTIFVKKQLVKYLITLGYYICVSFIASFISIFVCNYVQMNLWMTLICRFAICIIVPNCIFLIFYCKRIEFKQSVLLLNKILNGKLDRIVKKVKL